MESFKKYIYTYRSWIQNFLILILCITVVFEVSHLWFINLANGQSLYSGKNKSVAEQVYKEDFVSPARILKSIDKNEYYVIYEGETYNNLVKNSLKVLQEGAQKGNFMNSGNNTELVLGNRNLITFDYTYLIEGRMLQEAINTSKNTYNRINSFNKICYIISDGLFNIYFIDTINDTYSYYTLNNTELVNTCTTLSNGVYSDITYSYNNGDNKNIFDGELIANIDGETSYKKIQKYNPFTTIYGDSPRNLVESKVDGYFKNISYMKFSSSPSETAYVFSDTDTVVKYFNSGVLEYSYYNVIANSYEYSIVEDYAIAKGFIEHDADIVNKYYLKSYQRNNFETIFEFTYVANNYPIFYETDEGFSDTPISVTVRNNVVTNYKKNVYSFEVANSSAYAEKDLNSAISIFSNQGQEPVINNVMLGYKTFEDNQDEETGANLYWFLEAYGSKTTLATN